MKYTSAIICCLFFTLSSGADTHYVDLNSTNSIPPYTSWSTAASNIQDAVDVSVDGDQIIVNNGIYNSGFRTIYGATNRLAVNKAITVQSLSGAGGTIIDGEGIMRCVYLTNSASLIGFTLTNGSTLFGSDVVKELSGGGLWCESTNSIAENCIIGGNQSGAGYAGGALGGFLSNCVIFSNSALRGAGGYSNILQKCTISGNSAVQLGGGGFQTFMSNCLVISNHAPAGGGAFECVLNNCVFTGNDGGGAPFAAGGSGAQNSRLYNCTLYNNTGGRASYNSTNYNCILYGNFSSSGLANNFFQGVLTNCCSTPLPSGQGNFTNPPAFMNQVLGDFHLQSNSPCINAGNNAYVMSANDIDGNPRVLGGTVDVGAYEFQTPTSVISYAWLQQYGLPTDGSADFLDLDGDGMTDWQEWRAGTIPTNSLSVLQMLAPSNNASGIALVWQSVTNVTYFLQRATDLGSQAPFVSVQSNLVGRSGITSYTDTNATGNGPFFYRVGVQ